MYANCLDAIDDDPNKPFERKYYYIQDGLYNVRALVSAREWLVEEETSYDVYGKAVTYLSGDFDRDGSLSAGDISVFNDSSGLSECDPNFDWRCDVDYSGLVDSTDSNALIRNFGKGHASNQQSLFTNPYYFTGKRLDILDSGGLELMSWPYRNYLTSLARWCQHDKLGMIPNDDNRINPFGPRNQYKDGLNLYEYVSSNPVIYVDPCGLLSCGIYEYRDKGVWFWPFGHAGLLVGGRDIDFGPEKGGYTLGGLCPWPDNGHHATNKGTKWKRLLKKKETGRMKRGVKKGTCCRDVSCGDIADCVQETCWLWDGGPYHLWIWNCRTFVSSAKSHCCLQ